MSKKTIRKIQRVMRGVAMVGWIVFMLTLLFYMGGDVTHAAAATWGGISCGLMFIGLAFGGVIAGWIS